MDIHSTPVNNNRLRNFTVPPTPLLNRIGYGTGVSVYHLERSPKVGYAASPWALKKVNKKFAETDYAVRIKTEADILISLNHPNIIGFRGFSKTDDGREVLAMEECTQSLGDLIENYDEMQLGPFTPELIYVVIAGISKALAYLHNECKLLHGDMKSHNILIKDDFDMVKLCDFGVSLKLDENGEANAEDYVGTSSWSAPETFEDGPITAKADIFSLGLTIWEMLTLSVPHLPDTSDSVLDVSAEILDISEPPFGTRPSLDDVTLGPEYKTILEIFNSCTEQDLKKRPTAIEIIDKLKGVGVE